MNLGDMLDKIDGYRKILEDRGYVVKEGGGKKPWSVLAVHSDGTCIEQRASEWTLYDKDYKEIATGKQPESLQMYFLSKLNKSELIKVILDNRKA